MELVDKIKNTFNTTDSNEVFKNETYNFSIHILKPTRKNPYHIVFTSGLSDFAQNVSDKFPEFKHIELYFCLPDYWKIDNKSPEHNWPIKWLNRIAEVPQKNNSWFGPGDTLPAGNPPEELSDKLKQNHFILAEPMLFSEELTTVNLNDKSIKFLAIIPIYQKEIDFKLRNSAKVFMSKYQFKNHNELVDNYRETTVGKINYKYIWLTIIAILVLTAVAYVLFTDGSWIHEELQPK